LFAPGIIVMILRVQVLVALWSGAQGAPLATIDPSRSARVRRRQGAMMAGRHVGTAEPDHEHVVLLDESGAVVGTALKADVHTTDTLLHLAFSCYVVDGAGRVLLTRRASGKRTWPGVWTNACCGHPALDEEPAGAVLRRLRHELGIRGRVEISPLLPDFRYRAVMDNGVVENEICPVFLARVPAGVTVAPDPSEVADYRWVTPEEFRRLIAAAEQPVSPWAVLQMEQLAASDDWAAATL
jgi:isopentenyl-diphosphate delta-isomerase